MADFRSQERERGALFAKRGASGSGDSTIHSGNAAGRARGGLRGARISQVLSEARASLKEPSRPFTPASLDERAQNSLDGALNRALDRELSRTSSAASTGSGSNSRRGSAVTADIWVNDNVGDAGVESYLSMGAVHADGLSGGSFDGDVSNSGGNLQGLLAANLRNSLSDSDTGSVFHMGGGGGDTDDGSDILGEFNSGGYGSGGGYMSTGAASASGDERLDEDAVGASSLGLMFADLSDAATTIEAELGMLGGGNAQSLMQVLSGLSQPVDRLAKFVRRPALAPSGSALQDVESQRASLTRVLLRIVRPASNGASGGAAKQQPALLANEVRALTCRHLLRLYISQLQRGGRSSGSRGGSRSSKTGSNEVARGVLRVTRAMFEISSHSGGSTKEVGIGKASAAGASSSSGTSGAMLEGGLQLLLDLLAHVWDTVRAEVTSMGTSSAASSSSGTTSHPLSVLLEASVFAGGVVRIYSDESTNRKRLLHLGVVEALSHGFKVAVHAAKAVASGGETATGLHKHLVEQLGRLVEQLVGALRSFAQEAGGRSRILEAKVMGTVCSLLAPFRSQSELVLSAARITAKLSLLDTFRSQINAKQQNVKHLVEVVVHEADKCREVMLGETSSRAAETGGTWPQWHTWPLLSRVSFTLGNLTTSNAENRALIGISCSAIKPLVVLLQACACALSELYSQDNSLISDEDSFDRSADAISPARSPNREAEAEFETEAISESPTRDTRDAIDDADLQDVKAAAPTTSPAEQELTDATVKLLRLLANVCMDKNVGAAVAARMDVFEMLNEMLVCCNGRSEDALKAKQHEELLLNVVATCTNVTYYACHKQTASASTENVPKRQQTALIAMSKHLSQCLFHSNSEIVLETARALGNLTRLPTVLSSLTQSRTDEALVLLLSHKDMDVVSAVTGALINLSANARSRGLLTRESNALGALVAALRRSSLRNLPTSTLICQAFHNIVSASRAAGDEVADDALNPPGLSETLEELVDLADELDDDKYAAFVHVGRAVQQLIAS